MNDVYLGLDIGGTKCAAILGRKEKGGFAILKRKQIPTLSHDGPQQAIRRLFAAAGEIIAETGETPVSCGISCGGPLNSDLGLILSPPNLPGWDEVPITKLAAERFSIPAYLQNDANACALAEWLFGAGQGSRNMVFLTFGTGMGAGLILNGRLYEGTSSMAGEVGHIRMADHGPVGYGKAGSFEGFCSGGGIARLAEMMLSEHLQKGRSSVLASDCHMEPVTTQDVAAAAASGDQLAMEVIAASARYLGKGLALLIDILNPDCIVIGSIFARCEAMFRGEMEKEIAREALSCSAAACRIVPAGLGEKTGDYAALSVAACGRK